MEPHVTQLQVVAQLLVFWTHHFAVATLLTMENKTIGTRIVELAASDPDLSALNRKELAERFGITYEAFRKWIAGTGFPSKRNEIKVAQILGVPPETIAHGVQYVSADSDNLQDQGSAGIAIGKWLARPVSWSSVTIETSPHPTLVQWGDREMVIAHERFTVVAPDDSMEPIILEGARVILDQSLMARNKDIILVEDSSGTWYLRIYRQGPNDRWEAKAEDGGYLPMDSERDGLTILAVVDGIHGRRG